MLHVACQKSAKEKEKKRSHTKHEKASKENTARIKEGEAMSRYCAKAFMLDWTNSSNKRTT